jgi:hypothetical protein
MGNRGLRKLVGNKCATEQLKLSFAIASEYENGSSAGKTLQDLQNQKITIRI